MSTTTRKPVDRAGAAPRRPGTWRLPVVGTPVPRRQVLVGLALLVLTLALAVWALGLGDYPLRPDEVLHALVHDDGFASTIVRQWRAPRVVSALAVGAALGASGAIFQTLTRNPLGSPDIIGFTAGSFTGVLVVTTMLPAALRTALGGTAGGALVGGLLTALAVHLLASRGGLAGTRLVVVGIAVTAMLQSANLYLQTRAQAEVAMAASIWGAGTLSQASWHPLLWALPALVVLAVPTALVVPSMRQLELGDDAASSHGVRVGRTRTTLMVLGTCLVAVATALAGPIAFVALAAPQVAHRMGGGAGIDVLGSSLMGAFLLLGADLVAAHAFAHDLPVGIVTVIGGGLYLLVLLVAGTRR